MAGVHLVEKSLLTAATAFMLALGFGGPAEAFQLRPTGTDNEAIVVRLRQGWFGSFLSASSRFVIDHFTVGVHEELTHRIWGCLPAGSGAEHDRSCVTWSGTPLAVIYGVQWNDNPTFKLDETSDGRCRINTPIRLPDRQPECWAVLFGNAAKKAASGEYADQASGKALLYRSHFGDLQFLHAMASRDGEAMGDTKKRIMMWAEFAYRTSIGEIGRKARLSEVRIDGFADTLGSYWADVEKLFTYGVNRYSGSIPDVAFGSLLHMIQDSYSHSHVMRESAVGTCGDGASPNAGRILSFHAYGRQDAGKHGEEDERNAMLAGVIDAPEENAIAVGRHLKAYRNRTASWEEVRVYLDDCVFAVAKVDEGKLATAGPYGRR